MSITVGMADFCAALGAVKVHACNDPEVPALTRVRLTIADEHLIVSATDNVREIGDDEVHLLAYPPGDAAALAERLQRVVTDPALADRLVRAAHRHVGECFRQESIVERIERHLQEAIAAAPPSSR